MRLQPLLAAVAAFALLFTFTFADAQTLPVKTWTEIRDQFPNGLTLFPARGPQDPANDFNVTMHWKIIGSGRTEKLHMALGLLTSYGGIPVSQIPRDLFFWPYLAVGFGRSMVQGADFISCELNGAYTTLTVKERLGTKNYGPPRPNSNSIIEVVSGGFIGGVFYCEFIRPTTPNQPDFVNLNIRTSQPLLWSFNPVPTKNLAGDYFTYHGDSRRGYVQMSFAAGSGLANAVVSYTQKQVHGFGMMFVWLLLFPAAVLWSRYLRSVPNWLFIHMGVQVLGASAVLGFLVVIAVTVISFDGSRPHSIIGIILIVGMIVQVALGVLNLLGLSQEILYRQKERLRLVHAMLGLFLLLTSVITAGLGLDQLFPFMDREDRGVEFWYLYFLLSSFWVGIYTFLELFFRFRIRNTEKTKRSEKAAMKQPVDALAWSMKPLRKISSSTNGSKGNSNYMVASTNYVMPSSNYMMSNVNSAMDSVSVVKSSSVQSRIVNTTLPLEVKPTTALKQYSWESLDKSIQDGKLFVVGNGRFVYDISRWIVSHPGGQTILYTVAGTDISNDYWHEAGFDAADFTPEDSPLLQKSSRTERTNELLKRAGNTFSDRSSSSGSIDTDVRGALSNRESIQAQMQATPGLTDSDWKRILKSRRTHVHTQLALKRLAQLIVGEVQQTSSLNELGPRQFFDNPNGRPFNRYEYRRYALTEKVLLTTTGTSEAVKPVYRLRFCLLYPHDLRDKEPVDGFLPGECVEIQMRVNKSVVARYYTPISGNLSAFEIIVKVVPHGKLSKLLVKQKVGDRQVKVRGPFGAPLLAPHKPLSQFQPDNWMPDSIIMFSAGSGVTPFLQLIQFLLLPLWEPITAIQDFTAQASDELNIKRGDVILTKRHYFDGWAVGRNVSSTQDGFFPLGMTLPRLGVHYRTKILLVNSANSFGDIFGMDVMEGALLAYPATISIHHLINSGMEAAATAAEIDLNNISPGIPKSAKNKKVVTLPCGQVHDGTLTEERIRQLTEPIVSDDMKVRVFVCGPPEYESFVVDGLAEVGLHGDSVKILPHDRWLENI